MIFSVDSRPYPLTRIYDVFVNDFPSTWTVHGIFKKEWFFAAQALSLIRFRLLLVHSCQKRLLAIQPFDTEAEIPNNQQTAPE